jgi:hypothetical protein
MKHIKSIGTHYKALIKEKEGVVLKDTNGNAAAPAASTNVNKNTNHGQ